MTLAVVVRPRKVRIAFRRMLAAVASSMCPSTPALANMQLVLIIFPGSTFRCVSVTITAVSLLRKQHQLCKISCYYCEEAL